ncbi:MAG: hypothetical protein HKN01_05320 [Acidimicrobiia bacterium]|nr:hypothetical protein [Acidimicrobiia bacterium]
MIRLPTDPMRFDAYMEWCLYDPDIGFFASTATDVRSTKTGDFLTSPEVSSEFGRALGRFVAAEHARADIDAEFAVIDVGAGSGSLLRSLGETWTGQAVGIELSPAARESLAVDGLGGMSSFDAFGSTITGVVIANELIDNLPMAVVERTPDGWMEHAVTSQGGSLSTIRLEPRPEVSDWADRYAADVPIDSLVEVQLEAGVWVRDALERLDTGALVVIDYGGTSEELSGRRSRGGTIRTYRSHHLGPDPLTAPGETDITADVEFSALMDVCREAGAQVELTRQDEFLRSWGLAEVVSGLRQEELEAARAGDTMRQLQLKSHRLDAETLLHPRGLGDFRVLVARK